MKPEQLAQFFNGTWLTPLPQPAPIQQLVCEAAHVTPHSVLAVRSLREANAPGATLKQIQQRQIAPTIWLLTDRKKLHHQLPNPVLYVPSITEAVAKWVGFRRAQFQGQVFSLTGAVGKTTTSSILAQCLQAQGTCLVSMRRNLVNSIYARAVRMHKEDFAVFEVAQGALPGAAQALAADVAMLVSIAPAHMERHKTLLDLARCKAQIFAHSPPNGAAVIQRDVPHYEVIANIAQANGRRIISYGSHPDAMFRLEQYTAAVPQVTFRYAQQRYVIPLATAGAHIAMNALGVVACLQAAGIPWVRCLEQFKHWTQPPAGRGDEHVRSLPAGGACRVLNHTFNANPESMRAAILSLADYVPLHGGRRVLVLSDMLELGENSLALHAELAQAIQHSLADLVIVVGPHISVVRSHLPTDTAVIEFSHMSLFFAHLSALLQPDDVVLFKGSNGTGMHDALNIWLQPNSHAGV